MADWIGELAARVERDGRAVLVTIAHATGSTPREAGTAMVVGGDAMFGTIGGGHLEFEAIRIARDALAHATVPRRPSCAFRSRRGSGSAAAASPRSRSRSSRARARGSKRRAACARTARRSTSSPHRRPDAIAHVVVTATVRARSAAALDSAPIALARPSARARTMHVLVTADRRNDTRSSRSCPRISRCSCSATVTSGGRWCGCSACCPRACAGSTARRGFPADVPSSVGGRLDRFAGRGARDAPRGSLVVITTHDHALDFDLVGAALGRDDWGYLGLIGSASKRNQFEKRFPRVATRCADSRASPARSAARSDPRQASRRHRGRRRGGDARGPRGRRAESTSPRPPSGGAGPATKLDSRIRA